MGIVYAGYDEQLDRKVAIKLLRGKGRDHRLAREAQGLTRLSQALAIWKTALGPRHRNVAFGLSNIGNIHFGRGELDQALALYEAARRSLQRALVIVESVEVAPTARVEVEFGLAMVRWEQGEQDDARKLAFAARERSLAADNQEASKEIDAWLTTHGGLPPTP